MFTLKEATTIVCIYFQTFYYERINATLCLSRVLVPPVPKYANTNTPVGRSMDLKYTHTCTCECVCVSVCVSTLHNINRLHSKFGTFHALQSIITPVTYRRRIQRQSTQRVITYIFTLVTPDSPTSSFSRLPAAILRNASFSFQSSLQYAAHAP